MKRITCTFNLPTIVAVLAVGTLLAYQATGTPRAWNASTSVATLDLSRALEGLAQRADAEIDLNAMKQDIRNELVRREKTITDLQEQVTNAADEERTGVEEELALEQFRMEAWRKFVESKVDVEHALVLQDLYRSIKIAAAELAKTGQYDLVLVDDSRRNLEFNPNAPVSRVDQVQQQIRVQNMLYVSNAIDVTDDLVARMNNEHKNKNWIEI